MANSKDGQSLQDVGWLRTEAEGAVSWHIGIDWDTDDIILFRGAYRENTPFEQHRFGTTNAHYLATLILKAVKLIDAERSKQDL